MSLIEKSNFILNHKKTMKSTSGTSIPSFNKLKQVIIFGSLFSLVSISSALGYGLYVSVPAFQSVFLKLVAIGS